MPNAWAHRLAAFGTNAWRTAAWATASPAPQGPGSAPEGAARVARRRAVAVRALRTFTPSRHAAAARHAGEEAVAALAAAA